MLVFARFGEDPSLLGGLLETAQSALNSLAWSDANFHSVDDPLSARVMREN